VYTALLTSFNHDACTIVCVSIKVVDAISTIKLPLESGQ
jgi:hypothetical protein